MRRDDIVAAGKQIPALVAGALTYGLGVLK